MRRISIVLLLGLAIAVPAASSRSAADWKNLKYFDFASQQFIVATNEAWKGGRALKALPNQRLLPIQGPGRRETTPKWLWTTTCGPSPQFVSFARSILAPGVPSEGTLDFTLGFGRDLPFKSGVFLVNGTEVARLTPRAGKLRGFPTSFQDRVPARALKAFRYGINTLTIRAQRGALSKGQRCNSQNRLVGVTAILKLMFRPDVMAVPSPLGPAQVGAVASQRQGISGSLRFRNLGPSGSPGGRFAFDWAASGVETVFGAPSITGNVRNCKSIGVSDVAGKVECEYGDLPAGGSLAVNVRGIVETPARWGPSSSGDVSMSWEMRPAGSDVNYGNNTSGHKIVLCGAAATDPGCKK
jgi:hypothetical protein